MEPDHAAPYQLFPVAWPETEGAEDTTMDGLLQFVTAHDAPHDHKSIAQRYRRITAHEPQVLYKVPREPRIMNKLVWPLRQAKGAFALGNYLSTIALCGFVAEMAAILRYQIAVAERRPGILESPDQQRAMFGSSFERLGQERRVDILQALGLIDPVMVRRFGTIRIGRRKHLHFLSETTEGMAADAEQAYANAFGIVFDLMGHWYEGDDTYLYGKLMPYLDNVGYDTDRWADDP